MTPAAGYVYVAGLSNGTVKVGRSGDAVRRLREHKINARTLGLDVTDSWASPLHLEWLPNEDALKKIAADLGGVPEGREVFSGVEFDALVATADKLTFSAPPPALPAADEPRQATAAAPVQQAPAHDKYPLNNETIAILRHFAGPALHSDDPDYRRWFREQHPLLSEATEVMFRLEEAVAKLRSESWAA